MEATHVPALARMRSLVTHTHTQRERERERQRQRDRQTDRQTNRQRVSAMKRNKPYIPTIHYILVIAAHLNA